jgi:hypothetical protein
MIDIYKNVLTESTLLVVHDELIKFMNTPNIWTASTLKWDDMLKVNISGSTLVASISPAVCNFILGDLQDLIPHKNMSFQYYIWPPHAGISVHSDPHVKFGATIYLNETWDINDGGLFLYENTPNDWRVHVPEFNTMVINNDATNHMVTPVSPFAKHNRYTIQIFGEKLLMEEYK